MIDNICKYLMKKIENQIPDINEERKEVIMYGLEMLFTKIKAINGIDDYIRNITQPANDVLESEPPDYPPIPIPPDDFF